MSDAVAWDAKAVERGIEINPDFPMYCIEEDDGNVLEFHWDPDHPTTCVFNGWTESDFADFLVRAAEDVIAKADAEATT